MARYRFEIVILAAGFGIIAALALAMYRLSYDVWAGLVIAPVLVLVTVPMIRRILAGADTTHLFPIMVVGYLLKLAGSCARYYVVFDAYGRNADAERYFDTGSELAAAVRDGRASLFSVLPFARDAVFIERLSGFVLTFLGPTRLGGFFIFSTFAYLGTVCFVRAAAMAIPNLADRRYAWICILAPSLVFWPSSLGKEAWIICCLGFFSLGFAKVLTWNGRSGGMTLALMAAVGMGAVRPHLVAIFAGSATIGFAYSVLMPPEPTTMRRRGSLLGFTLVASAGLVASSLAAVRFLNKGSEDQGVLSGITTILNRTNEQTLQGGSSFTPIDIDNPIRWPFAAARTLTRPLLMEAHSLATLLPALETSLFLAVLALGWRRTLNLPRTLRRSPYLMYALIAMLLYGVAFSAIGNLGILVRQRSIVVPFMALLLCLPARPLRTVRPRTTLPGARLQSSPRPDRPRATLVG